MKRTISWVLVFVVLVSVFTPASAVAQSAYDPLVRHLAPIDLSSRDSLPKVNGFDFDYLPATSVWKNIVGTTQPAKLQGVTYSLADNVVTVDKTVSASIRSAGQVLGATSATRPAERILAEGGFISKTLLQSVAGSPKVQPGTVFFDPAGSTAFKVVSPMSPGELTYPFSQNYSLTRPEINEVVKEFNLPDQDLDLTSANITGFADSKIESCIQTPSLLQPMAKESNFLQFKHLQDPLISMIFPAGFTLKGYLGDGQEVTVSLSGGLGIGDLGLDARYSAFDGYMFALDVTQEAFLDVDVGIDVNQEVRIPIFGIDIGFGVGSVTGGLFLICTLDGKINVEIQARQWATTSIGVAGSTFCCIPVSAIPYFGMPEKGMTGDVQISGQINGTIKAGAMIAIEIFGWELVGAGVFVGAGLTVSASVGPPPTLEVELYGLVQVYVCLLGEQYDLVNFHLTIFKRKQSDMGTTYRVKIEEADAYRDLVGGIVEKYMGANAKVKWLPASGVTVGIRVSPDVANGPVPTVDYAANGTASYTTNEYGEFWADDIDLKLKDKVQVLLDDSGVQRVSDFVLPTFPFSRIVVDEADYYNDYVVGHVVPVQVRKWGVHTGVAAEETETLTYVGPIVLEVMKSTGLYFDYTLGQSTTAQTDALGRFVADSDPEPVDASPAETASDGLPLDILPTDRFTLVLKKDGFLVTSDSMTQPTVAFALRRVIEKEEGSSSRFFQGPKTIDRSVYNERIYVINLRGTRQPTDISYSYRMIGFSSQDRMSKASLYFTYLGPGWSNPVLAVDLPSKVIAGLYPTETKLVLSAKPGEPDGTALIDNRIFTEWVWQPHTNPTVMTSADHFECTTGDATFPLSGTGVVPLAFTLTGAPAGVSLDPATGVLTVAKTVAAGTYLFPVTLTAASTQYPPDMVFPYGTYPEYRQDDFPPVTKTFTLTVTSSASPTPTTPPTGGPPVITSADHTQCTSAGGSFQVTATGKTPITYSLSSSSIAFNSVPAQVSIHPDTGLMTFTSDFPKKTYTFYVNAANGVAPDAKQLFTLTVGATLLAPSSRSPLTPVLFATNTIHTPVNTFVLRNDDPEDLYTNDMFWVDGSEYVKWDGVLTLGIEGAMVQATLYDGSPTNDHHLWKLTPEQRAAAKAANDQLIEDESKTGTGFDLSDGFGGLPGGFGTGDGFDLFGAGGVLDFGSILDGFGLHKGGLIDVVLGGGSGTVIPGDVFVGLEESAGSRLRLTQKGATITFGSEDILSPDVDAYIDFGFTEDAPHAEGMLEALGGADGFTYGFAHSGKMPGMARFAIQTGLAPGLEVNVYRFDASTKTFTAIAEGLQVGAEGFVGYENDTLSEYVITKKKLAGVARADVYDRNRPSFFGPWTVWAGGGAVLVLLVLGAVLVARRRRSRKKEKPASV